MHKLYTHQILSVYVLAHNMYREILNRLSHVTILYCAIFAHVGDDEDVEEGHVRGREFG